MTSSTLELTGKLQYPPNGIGPRVVAGLLSVGYSETVRPKDLGLKTIHELHLINEPGTMSFVHVQAPGSYGNYASVTFWRVSIVSIGTTPTAAIKGVAISSGTKTFRFSAVGE